MSVSTEQQSYNSQRFEIEKWCAKMGFEVDRCRSKDWYRFEKLYPEIKSRLAANETIGQIASDLKIHRNTLSRYLKEKKSAGKQKNPNTF